MAIKKVFELGETTSSSAGIRGNAISGYELYPILFLRQIVDAAKKKLYAVPFVYQTEAPVGTKDVVVPTRTVYMGSGSFSSTASEGSTISWTTLNNLSGVTLTPTDENFGVALTYKAIRTHALDLVKHAREEMTYAAGDAVDIAVFNALTLDSNRSASDKRGSQAIYGGDANQASSIAAGNIITTEMVAEGKRKLQSTACRYWTYGTSEGTSSQSKNPWSNEPGAPFVLFVAPEQEEAFLKDSQFINAAEYGGREVIANGEIGNYLGVKVVVSPNTPAYGASTGHPDGSTTAVAQHRCIMIKAQKAAAIAWGQKPKLYVFDYPSELERRIALEQAYQVKQLYADAIVHINVADT